MRQMPRWRERVRLFVPFRSWKLQIAAAAIAVVAAILSAQSFASAREAAATYLIQPGDTLLAISSTTGVGIDKLANWNGIKDPNVIIAGQTLSLIGAANAPPPASQQYTVKAGDTLWGIAQSTNTSVG